MPGAGNAGLLRTGSGPGTYQEPQGSDVSTGCALIFSESNRRLPADSPHSKENQCLAANLTRWMPQLV